MKCSRCVRCLIKHRVCSWGTAVILLLYDYTSQRWGGAWARGGMLGFATGPGSVCSEVWLSQYRWICVTLFKIRVTTCEEANDQRTIRDHVLPQKSYIDTNQLIQQAYGDSALLSSQTSRWLKMFKDVREEVKANTRSGWPLTRHNHENATRVSDQLKSDLRKGESCARTDPQIVDWWTKD